MNQRKKCKAHEHNTKKELFVQTQVTSRSAESTSTCTRNMYWFFLLHFFFVYWILYNSPTENVWQHRPEGKRIEIFAYAKVGWSEASLFSREEKMVVIWPKSLNCLMLIISITPFSSFTMKEKNYRRSHHMTKEIILSRRVASAVRFSILDSMAERTNWTSKTNRGKRTLAPFNYLQLKLKMKHKSEKKRIQTNFIE